MTIIVSRDTSNDPRWNQWESEFMSQQNELDTLARQPESDEADEDKSDLW